MWRKLVGVSSVVVVCLLLVGVGFLGASAWVVYDAGNETRDEQAWGPMICNVWMEDLAGELLCVLQRLLVELRERATPYPLAKHWADAHSVQDAAVWPDPWAAL